MAFYGEGGETNLESNDDCFNCKKKGECERLAELKNFTWRVNDQILCEHKDDNEIVG